MDDPRMLKPDTNDDRSAPPGAGSAAAWLAHCGMVALLVVEESNATRDENTAAQSAATRWRRSLRIRLPTESLKRRC